MPLSRRDKEWKEVKEQNSLHFNYLVSQFATADSYSRLSYRHNDTPVQSQSERWSTENLCKQLSQAMSTATWEPCDLWFGYVGKETLGERATSKVFRRLEEMNLLPFYHFWQSIHNRLHKETWSIFLKGKRPKVCITRLYEHLKIFKMIIGKLWYIYNR